MSALRSPDQRSWLDVAWLGLLLAVAWASIELCWHPSATSRSEDIPFDLARAFADTAVIASNSHAMGTPAHAAVREWVVGEMTKLGMQVDVQDGFSLSPVRSFGSGGRVRNIIGRMAGRQPGHSVVLVAHYDSVPTGPGAADDGASVASILGVLRSLRSRGLPEHEVLAVFTDGEEPGLLGAEYLMKVAGLPHEISAVLNYDYRGNAGPMMLFQNGEGSAPLVEALAKAAPHAMVSSAFAEAYRYLPNNTDGTVFLDAGMPLLNFAAIGGISAYHSRLDTVAALDRETLLDQGATMLALVRALTDDPPPPDDVSRIFYFSAPIIGVVTYRPVAAWGLSILVTLLSAVTWIRLARRDEVRLRRVLAGVLVMPVIIALATVTVAVSWYGVRKVLGSFQGLLEPYDPAGYRWALVAMPLAAMTILTAGTRRVARPAEIVLGALVFATLIQLACTIQAPGASYLLAIPTLFASLGLHIAKVRDGEFRRPWGPWVACCASVAILSPFLYALIVGLTISSATEFVAVLTLLSVFLIPAMVMVRKPVFLASFLMVSAVAALGSAAAHTRVDSSHPKPETLSLITDADSAQSYWVSSDAVRGQWVSRFTAAATKREDNPGLTGFAGLPFWVAKAADIVSPSAPSVLVERDETRNGVRTLTIMVRSIRSAPRIRVTLDGAQVTRSIVNGQPYVPPQDRWRLDVSGVGDDPIRITVDVAPGHAIALRVADVSYGVDAMAPGRPASSMPTPYGLPDGWQIVRRTKLSTAGGSADAAR